MPLNTRQILDLADTTIASLTVCSPLDVGFVEKQGTTYFAYFEGQKDPAVVATYEGEEWPGAANSEILSASIYCNPSQLANYVRFLNDALIDPATYGEDFREAYSLPPTVQLDKINLIAVL